MECDWATVKQIKELLSGRFYVPVIRSVDNSLPPMIGEPFSPKNPPVGQNTATHMPFIYWCCHLCPPVQKLQFDPLSPEMEIQAYAGPMNREEAHTFRRRWKTPPRTNGLHNSSHHNNDSPLSSSFSLLFSPSATTSAHPALRFTPAKVSTPAKVATSFDSTRPAITSRQLFGNGHQSNGVSTAATMDTDADDSIEAGSGCVATADCDDALGNSSLTGHDADLLLDSPPSTAKPLGHAATTELSSPFRQYRQHTGHMLDDSISILNVSATDHVRRASMNASVYESPMYRERHAKLCDSEKGLEVIGRELASQRHVKWREYWPFLDAFVDIRSADGLVAFEERLVANANARLKEEEAAAAERLASAAAQLTPTKATTPTSRISAMTAAAASLKETSISLLCKALSQLEVKGAFSADGRLPTAPPVGLVQPPVLQVQPMQPAYPSNRPCRTIVQQTQPPPSAFSAYLYAERSLQVYAKRVIDTMRSSAAATTAGTQSCSIGTIKRDHLSGEFWIIRRPL